MTHIALLYGLIFLDKKAHTLSLIFQSVTFCHPNVVSSFIQQMSFKLTEFETTAKLHKSSYKQLFQQCGHRGHVIYQFFVSVW